MIKYIAFGCIFLLLYFGTSAQTLSRALYDSLSKIPRVQFNLQGTFIVNNSLSNLNFKVLYPENTGKTENYTKSQSKPICFGFNVGAEFILGRSPNIKQILGLAYDYTNSFYNYNVAYKGGFYLHGQNETWHETIARNVQFVNLNYGLLISVTKKLKIGVIASLTFYTKVTDVTNGYHVISAPPFAYNAAYYDSTVYNNSKTVNDGLNLLGAVKLRTSYDITKYLSVFAARNFGLGYKAPWWMIGLQFYPFKNYGNIIIP